jgi:hypothetical protein
MPDPTGTVPTYTDGSARIAALLAAGTSVSIPDGVYLLSSPINPRNGQVIAPANAGKVVLKAAAGYTGQLVNSVDVSYTLRGLILDGAYASRTAQEGAQSAALVSITGGTNVTLDGNTFQYAPAYAVWTWRTNAPQIRNNRFVETYHPVRMDGNNLPGGTIEANTFVNTAAYHSIQQVEAVNTQNLVVRGNTMSGAGLGVPVSHGYEGTWGNSIYIFNSTGYLIEGNTIGANYWSAIVSGQNGTNATIRANKVKNGQYTTQAVWIEQVGAQNVTLDNNDIAGGVSVGDTGGDYLTITNNRINAPGVGIDFNFAAKHATVTGNTITSTASYRSGNGMYLWDKSSPDTNIQISNNSINGFDKGIAVNNPGGTGTVYGIHLSGNTFSGNNTNVWVPGTLKLAQPLGQ